MSAQIDAFIKEITRCFGAPPASITLRQGDTEETKMSGEISEGAWSAATTDTDLPARGHGQAPQATVEALMYSLRERGVKALEESDTQRRLVALDKSQLKEVCRRVQNFKPHIAAPWSREETTTLVSNWRKLHGQAHQ